MGLFQLFRNVKYLIFKYVFLKQVQLWACVWLRLQWNHNIMTPVCVKIVYLPAFNLILHLRLVWHSENAVIVHGMPWSNLNLIDSNKLVVFNLLNDKVAQYYARMNWIGFIVKLQPLVKITRSWLFFSPCYNPNPTKERHFQTVWGTGGRHTSFLPSSILWMSWANIPKFRRVGDA